MPLKSRRNNEKQTGEIKAMTLPRAGHVVTHRQVMNNNT